ncbi:FAD binding domain-containing protein [Cladophialophora immunda]|nr:FAD binding domain-containing protein [Cladophialophora immunda]
MNGSEQAFPSSPDSVTASRRLRNGRDKDVYYKPFPPNYFAPKAGHQTLNIGVIGAGVSLLDAHSLEVLRRVDIPDTRELYGAPWYLFHRVDLHQQLNKLATEPRLHTKAVAKLNLATGVADIDLDGTITLVRGDRVKKDLIIVADGVRSSFTAKVVGDDVLSRATPTGTAVYRFLIPTARLLEDPQTQPLFQNESFCGSIARLKHSRLVWYPCRQGALQNFGLFVPDEIDGFENEVWNIPASREKFMESCRGLHPDLQAVCSKAEGLKLFRLCTRKMPIPTLTKGNVVLIGDAAHPMLPHQAQGGAMAVEDGAALGVLFSDLMSQDAVQDRLDMFQRLRLDRVSAIQILSSVGQDEIHKVIDSARPYVEDPIPTTPDGLNEYNFTPNVMRDALELLHPGSKVRQ